MIMDPGAAMSLAGSIWLNLITRLKIWFPRSVIKCSDLEELTTGMKVRF